MQKESLAAAKNGPKTTINLTSNDNKAIKVGTTNTPVKTGFHLATNSAKKERGSPNNSEHRRRSDAQLIKNDSSLIGKLKPNSSFSSLNSMNDSLDKGVTSTPSKATKNQVDFKVCTMYEYLNILELNKSKFIIFIVFQFPIVSL